MISQEEAIALALKTSGYSDEEIAQEVKQDESYKFYSIREGDSNWRPGHIGFYETGKRAYYPDCWIIGARPVSTRNRIIKDNLTILDGPEDWYWIDKHTGVIVFQGGG